jgi:hypothetical protein
MVHVAIPERGRQHVVSIRVNGRGHMHALAGRALDGEAAAIELGHDPFDRDAAAVVWFLLHSG